MISKLPSLNGNYIDLLLILIFLYFVSEAVRYHFLIILSDFLGFLLSLTFALKFYGFAADFLKLNFSLPPSLSKALGFLISASILEAFFGFLFTVLVKRIPPKFWKKLWLKALSIFPALGQGIVFASFILTLVIALPFPNQIKKDISDSKIGGFLVEKTLGLEKDLNEIFGKFIEDSLTYLIVDPRRSESIPINVYEDKLLVDPETELKMFDLVNEERKKHGEKSLEFKMELVLVARGHAEDMWRRRYFGHISPEGMDVGDRLSKANISYNLAGENLALAPTLQIAHTGLMNSEGHRANILNPKFGKIGIGVVENGIYGKMFVQVFTD